jgi:hypothetical protein
MFCNGQEHTNYGQKFLVKHPIKVSSDTFKVTTTTNSSNNSNNTNALYFKANVFQDVKAVLVLTSSLTLFVLQLQNVVVRFETETFDPGYCKMVETVYCDHFELYQN